MNYIDRLKNNREAFGLMDAELRRVAEKIGSENFHEGTGRKLFAWDNCEPPVFECRFVYQLRPDWVCDHREWMGKPRICSWCGAEIQAKIPAEKKGRWVEYEIFKGSGDYLFSGHDKKIEIPLKWAPGMVGFGGTKYRAPCDCQGYKKGDMSGCLKIPPCDCEIHGPWEPKFVRFFEVGK